MEKMKYGYARVSTHLQTTDTQVEQLKKYGADYIFTETKSGVKERPELKELMRVLQKGDELHITKLDRLGRSARELHEIAAELEERGVVLVIGGVEHDPTTAMGRLVFNNLAMIAEFERDMIAERTKERLDAIRAAGGRVGRKRVTNPQQEALILDLHNNGYSNSEIRKVAGISNSVLYRILREEVAATQEAADPTIARRRHQIEAKAAKDRAKALKTYTAKYAALKDTEETNE